MGLRLVDTSWRSWRDFAPLYAGINLPLILLVAALMVYLPSAKPVPFANVSREAVLMLQVSGALLSTVLSFPWQYRFLRRWIERYAQTGRFNIAKFALGFYWRNLLVSIITAVIVAVPLVYLIFFLVSLPLMMMLMPVHLLSGLLIGLVVHRSQPSE